MRRLWPTGGLLRQGTKKKRFNDAVATEGYRINPLLLSLNSYNKTNQMRLFLKFIFGIKLYMFRTFPLSIISSLFTVHTAKVYVIQLASRIRTFRPDPARKLSANLYDIYRCCGYSEKTPDDGQRSCPKHAEFYSKNKFEKLVHLVGFIIRIYHDARSPERQIG